MFKFIGISVLERKTNTNYTKFCSTTIERVGSALTQGHQFNNFFGPESMMIPSKVDGQ